MGELIRLNRNVPVVTRPKDEGGQTNLWGEQEIEQALLPEKAEVSDYIRKQLAGEKRLFGAVSNDAAAQTLTQGGNVIQTQANQQRAQQANQGIVLYDKLSERTGPIDDILNQAAQSLAGEPNAAAQAKIKRDAHAAVRDHLAAQLSVLTGGAPSGAPVHPPHDAGGTPATGAGQPSTPAAQPEVSQPQSAQGETPAVAPEAPSVSPGPAPGEPAQTPSPVGAEEPHDFSSTQANLPQDIADQVRALGARIKDEDLAEDGRETQPHVTVRYGLHGEDPEAVRKLLANEPPIQATIGKASVFHTDDGDVLKLDVDSPDLHRLNGKLSTLEHTDTHPGYKPHITVAYLKHGAIDKYLFQGAEGADATVNLTGQKIDIPSIAFSSKNGEQTEIPLGGKTPATATPPTEANPKTPHENIPPPQPTGVEPKTPSAAGAAGLNPDDIIANLKKKLAEKQGQKPAEAAPAQQQLFTPGEPGQTIPGTTPAKLLGEQLTAQLKSGMAARPSKLKPSTGNRGLFEEERPEQGALFARRPTPLRLVDTGQKSPSGAVVYKLHDGKIVLPYAGTEAEMRAAGAKMGRAVEAGAAPGTAQWVLDYVKQNGPVHVLDLAAHSGLSRAQFQPILLKLIGQGKVDADDFLLPGEKDRSGKVSDDYADAVAALQSRRMEGFYSQLERVVEQKMQARSSPQQLLAMLRNPQNGVKSDELAWSGLEQFLEDRKGVPVTKQEVQDFLKQNEVRVEEVTHGQTVDKERIAHADAELKAAQQDVSEQQARSVDFKEGDRVATVGSAASVGGYSYRSGKVYEVQRNRAGILVWKVAGDFGGTRSGRSDKRAPELKVEAKYPWMSSILVGHNQIVRNLTGTRIEADGRRVAVGGQPLNLARLERAEREGGQCAAADKSGTPTTFQQISCRVARTTG